MTLIRYRAERRACSFCPSISQGFSDDFKYIIYKNTINILFLFKYFYIFRTNMLTFRHTPEMNILFSKRHVKYNFKLMLYITMSNYELPWVCFDQIISSISFLIKSAQYKYYISLSAPSLFLSLSLSFSVSLCLTPTPTHRPTQHTFLQNAS